MLTLTKFICGCFGIGALVLLGMALFETAGTRTQPSVASACNAIIQSAVAETGSVYRQASLEAGPRLRYFAASSGPFVHANLITAKYQLEGMRNAAAARLSTNSWGSSPEPSWIRNGVQGARQASTEKTLAMANAMPQFRAVKTDLQRFADAHPSFAAAGF